MGHLVNPISFRLGKTLSWSFVWSSFLKKNYKYLILQDLQFTVFFRWLLSLKFLRKLGLVFSHFKIFRLRDKVIFVIFFINKNKYEELENSELANEGFTENSEFSKKITNVFKLEKGHKNSNDINYSVQKVKKNKNLVEIIGLKNRNKIFLTKLEFSVFQEIIEKIESTVEIISIVQNLKESLDLHITKIFSSLIDESNKKFAFSEDDLNFIDLLIKRGNDLCSFADNIEEHILKNEEVFLEFKGKVDKFVVSYFTRYRLSFNLKKDELKKIFFNVFVLFDSFFFLLYKKKDKKFRFFQVFLNTFSIRLTNKKVVSFEDIYKKIFEILNEKEKCFIFFELIKKILFFFKFKNVVYFSKDKKNSLILQNQISKDYNFNMNLFDKDPDQNLNKLFLILIEKRILFLFNFFFIKSYEYMFFFAKHKFLLHSYILNSVERNTEYLLYINAYLISRLLYEALRLKRYDIKKAISSVAKFVDKTPNVRGYRIAIAGRLTRTRRGVYAVFFDGKVPLSTLHVPIDYSTMLFRTKFGMCGIKVWLNKDFSLAYEEETFALGLYYFVKNYGRKYGYLYHKNSKVFKSLLDLQGIFYKNTRSILKTDFLSDESNQNVKVVDFFYNFT